MDRITALRDRMPVLAERPAQVAESFFRLHADLDESVRTLYFLLYKVAAGTEDIVRPLNDKRFPPGSPPFVPRYRDITAQEALRYPWTIRRKGRTEQIINSLPAPVCFLPYL